MNDIATATRCSCGAPVHVSETEGPTAKAWQALCRECYDGTEDAGDRAHVRGFGATPEAALWDWQCVHDDAHEVEWCLADLFGDLARRVSQERDRQRGWIQRSASAYSGFTLHERRPVLVPAAIYYGPEQ